MRHVRVEPSGCWIWIGATYGGPAHRESHGSWRPDQQKSPVGAHVWIYEQTVGPVPEGMHLDHFKCDRPLCVNPEHVRPATPRENTLRGNSFAAWNAAKTHCIHGHEFTPENTYLHKGSRLCRACRARSWRASGGRKSRARATN